MTVKKYTILLLSIFLATIVILWIYIAIINSKGLPSIEQLENPPQNLATQVLSSDGEILDLFSIQRRIYLPYDSIPKDFINGLIAVEDRKFYKHWGIHLSRVFKAAIKNILAADIAEGASTITMQLARNLFLNQRTTLERKIQEAYIAIQIERTYTKEEILELYANTVIFGRGAWGLQVAAAIYFDKPATELTTSECAYLVGILKNPEHYNGLKDMNLAISRRNLVLNLMYEQGYISNSEYQKAIKEPLNITKKRISVDKRFMLAPHFVEMIRTQISKNELNGKNLYTEGYIINTTLNSRIQKLILQATEEHMTELQEIFNRTWSWSKNKDLLKTLIKESIHKRPEYIYASNQEKIKIENYLMTNKDFIDSVKNAKTTIQCAVVVLDPQKGSILGMIGASPKFMMENRDAKYSLNHATQIKRQPGSSFKPILYASVLEQGLNPWDMVCRTPFTYIDPFTNEKWTPKGSGKGIEEDSVTLYRALIHSINTASARLITEVTNPSKVISLAYRMGITTPLFAVPALSLGAGGEVIPLEMFSTFSTFANHGIHVKPFAITSITDKNGNTIVNNRKYLQANIVLNDKIAETIKFMLSGVVNYGTGIYAKKYFSGVDAAGKTGTSNDFADAWFIGFTPELLIGVWVGFDDRRITFTGDYGYASFAAAPLWGRIIGKIYSDNTLPFNKRIFDYPVIDTLTGEKLDQYLFRMINSKGNPKNIKNENKTHNLFDVLPQLED